MPEETISAPQQPQPIPVAQHDIPPKLAEVLKQLDSQMQTLQGKKSDLLLGFLMSKDIRDDQIFSADEGYKQAIVYDQPATTQTLPEPDEAI